MTTKKGDTVVKNKKIKKKVNPLKRTLAVIGTTVLSLVLIVVITGSIVATALTVYVMKFMDDKNDIDLYNLDLASTTIVYAYDKEGNEIEVDRLSRDVNRILVDINTVPEYVKMAFVCVEDERFFEHRGVDFKRTFAAFANMFLHFYNTEQGGSTITQQLVKNVTSDDDVSITRKIREIFRAMSLEGSYTKTDILEAYLNYIGFGGTTCGIQAAANKYFDKDVSELSLAEAASLAAIPKDPENINPFADPEANKERQLIVLKAMLKNSVISDQEYEKAIKEELVFANQTKVDENGNVIEPADTGVQSYFTDMVVFDVADDLQELYGLESQEEAIDMIMSGGYKIYTTEDVEMQNTVQAKFLDYTNFSANVLTDPPQAAFICMDYNGNIKAVVGGIGEKPSALCMNRATMATRSPGSTIKPITTYGYGLSMDLFNWSTVFIDKPMIITDNGVEKQWPKNYSNTWSYNRFFTFDALQRSLNTIAAQLCERETPRAVFDFTTQKMGITTLVESRVEDDGRVVSDVSLAPLAVGSVTDGVYLREMVSAYQAFGNLGVRYDSTSYTKVVDSTGKVILEHAYNPIQALDQDTAYVMNKLMQQVVAGPNGTGRAARLNTTPIAAKTGTTEDWRDLSFIACTPDYVSGIWFGHDESTIYDEKSQTWIPNSIKDIYYSTSKTWKNIFGEIAENETGKTFPENTSVKPYYFDTVTGKICNESCATRSTAPGYYKPSYIPVSFDGDYSKVETFGGDVVAVQTTTTAPATTTAAATAAGNAPEQATTTTSDTTTTAAQVFN